MSSVASMEEQAIQRIELLPVTSATATKGATLPPSTLRLASLCDFMTRAEIAGKNTFGSQAQLSNRSLPLAPQRRNYCA